MRQLRLVEPHVVTSGTVEAGRPADVMLRAARGAFVLVVGAHGPGSCAIPGGSIARWAASHARCPVVAAQRTPRPAGPVVAAIDGSARSETVLETALDEASVRRAPLVVTWALRVAARVPERALVSTGAYPGFGDPPDATGPDGDVAATYEAVASAASETLSELLARWGPKYPMVTTEVQVNAQDPVRMLVRASITSQLLVVGARRGAGRDGLGRVTRAVLDGARCPVMVVRSRA
jgi:nucleotide-binding universal stress UspA family protein